MTGEVRLGSWIAMAAAAGFLLSVVMPPIVSAEDNWKNGLRFKSDDASLKIGGRIHND